MQFIFDSILKILKCLKTWTEDSFCFLVSSANYCLKILKVLAKYENFNYIISEKELGLFKAKEIFRFLSLALECKQISFKIGLFFKRTILNYISIFDEYIRKEIIASTDTILVCLTDQLLFECFSLQKRNFNSINSSLNPEINKKWKVLKELKRGIRLSLEIPNYDPNKDIPFLDIQSSYNSIFITHYSPMIPVLVNKIIKLYQFSNDSHNTSFD